MHDDHSPSALAFVGHDILFGIVCFAALAAVAVVLVVLWLVLRNRDSRNTPAQREVSAQPPTFRYGQQAIQLTHGEITAFVSHLAIQRPPHQHEFYYELRLPWPTPEFRLELFPASGRSPQRVFPGLENILGEIDEEGLHFEVLANDPRSAQRFLSEPVQNQINLLYRFGSADLHLTIAGGCLLVRKRDPSGAMRDLPALSRLVFQLYDLATAATEPGLEWLAESDGWTFETAICGICGENVESEAVQCLSCQTPHHRQCWEYFGACSIYACGETQFVIVGTAATEVLKPKSIPRRRDWYRTDS